jgi:hypothetical protein
MRENEESGDLWHDAELEDALEILKQLTQAQAAAEIGISARRFRDIERTRATPRRRTRDAIIRLAEDVRSGYAVGENEISGEPEGGNSFGPIIFGVLLLVASIVAILKLSKPPEV